MVRKMMLQEQLKINDNNYDVLKVAGYRYAQSRYDVIYITVNKNLK